MLQEIDMEEWDSVAHLFDEHVMLHTVVFQCARLGMGSLQVDEVESPSVALYTIPLMSFLAGDATSDTAISVVESLPPLSITVAPNREWRNLIQDKWGQKLKSQHRIRLSPKSLDIGHIRQLRRDLPSRYELQELDGDSAAQITQDYERQIELFFGSVSNLLKEGSGYCILMKDKLVSFAYTAFPFIDEFEIQVFTEDSPEHRRKGLATAVSAALIEHGLENELVPNWDAANPPSVGLALKLGYTNPIPYDVYYYLPEKKL